MTPHEAKKQGQDEMIGKTLKARGRILRPWEKLSKSYSFQKKINHDEACGEQGRSSASRSRSMLKWIMVRGGLRTMTTTMMTTWWLTKAIPLSKLEIGDWLKIGCALESQDFWFSSFLLSNKIPHPPRKRGEIAETSYCRFKAACYIRGRSEGQEASPPPLPPSPASLPVFSPD